MRVRFEKGNKYKKNKEEYGWIKAQNTEMTERREWWKITSVKV